jgi:hypothetical protein
MQSQQQHDFVQAAPLYSSHEGFLRIQGLVPSQCNQQALQLLGIVASLSQTMPRPCTEVVRYRGAESLYDTNSDDICIKLSEESLSQVE